MMEKLKTKLEDPQTPLSKRYRVLFALKNMKDSNEAHQTMLLGLKDVSTLFRHEVAYCLGQTQNEAGIPELVKILQNLDEHPMVRHEAGEALGAIGTDACIPYLEQYVSDAFPEVRETCMLALQRIQNRDTPKASDGRYASVDPAPAATQGSKPEALESCLLDEEASMFDRYGALFALRNIGDVKAVQSITKAFKCSSALLKHEVAFVLGQMQNVEAVSALKNVLQDEKENPMVRHEAAEALGSIADASCVALLKQYSQDPEPIVADSCIVALDMLEHEQSGTFEYVDCESHE